MPGIVALTNHGKADKKMYYESYEKRYQAVESAEIGLWGNSEKDVILADTLKKWVEDNGLKGKSVIEFACGEGSCGIILSKLGVRYFGADIAPTAVKRARERLRDFPEARIEVLDMVREAPAEKFDAALDVMGFHMIVTDGDRRSYLKNACGCIKKGAPMLFFRENYDEEAAETVIETIEDFKKMTGNDYDAPQKRLMNGKEVYIPLLPARARSREGYINELEEAGFAVESFTRSAENDSIIMSADIYARKKHSE